MTAVATLPVLLGVGVHGSRPAAGDVGKGGIYSCTTHSLIYQTDGSSWTTWATLTGTFVTSLIAVTHNTTGGNKSTTSSTQADIDATNSIVTFTAPASGIVLVRLGISVNLDGASNQNCFLGIREGSTDVVNKLFADQCPNGVATEHVCWIAAKISGLSAGSHTYKAAFAVNGGITMTVRQSSTSPVIMEVWAA